MAQKKDNRTTTQSDVSDFPLHAFPKKILEMANGLADSESFHIEYLLVSMVSAIASATGNALQIRIKGGWTSSPIFYIILVGRPGLGKTPPLDFAYRPIRAYDFQNLSKFRAMIEKAQNEKGSSTSAFGQGASSIKLSKIMVSDFTPEALMQAHNANQRGIVVFVDEIMGMFNSVNQYSKGQLIEQFLTAYSGKAIDITRCSMEIPIHIEMPCINMIGTAQPKRLLSLFNKGYKDNGLIDRILFAYPFGYKIPYWDYTKRNSSDAYKALAEQWENIINDILSLPCDFDKTGLVVPTILDFTNDARDLFYVWRNETILHMNVDDEGNEIDERIMKTHLSVARFSLIFQIMKWTCNEAELDYVDEDSVKSAILLNEYFENCYNRIEKLIKYDEALVKKEGLKADKKHTSEDRLQSYCMKRVEQFLNERGRQIIGWDEILEGDVAPNATVMSWRGMQGGIEAAKLKHDVIMTPNDYVYFDYYQSADKEQEPMAMGSCITVEKVYNFEPVADELADEEKKHILGAQANVWTEYIGTPEHVEYMMVPRMAALAEVQWMMPEKKSYQGFLNRLGSLAEFYKRDNVNYAKHILPEVVPAQTK